ncbi:hypothetical protein FRC00_002457 [Tulasnella sp. 408]|nr:hypothetical protein FRC00_002457 [Tulasnella sp. 408]
MSNQSGASDNQTPRVSFTVRRPSPVSSRHAGPESNADTPTSSFRTLRQQAIYPAAPSRLIYEQEKKEEVKSFDEEDPEAAELVSGFDSMGVQRLKPVAKTNGPLTIPLLKHGDWRQLAKQRQAANGYIPDSARASATTGPDGSQGGLGTRDSINSGPQLAGLVLTKRSNPPAEPTPDESNETEPEVDGDTEMTPAQPLTEDEIALQALLHGTDESTSKPQVAAIPLAPMNEEAALQRDTATLEDYARVPIEQFGMAMLRGMGWRPPKTGEDVLWIPAERPALLGLGAKARPAAQTSGGDKSQPANWKNTDRKYIPLVKKDRNGAIVDEAKDSASNRPRSGQGSRRNSRSRSPQGQFGSSRRDREREYHKKDRDYRDWESERTRDRHDGDSLRKREKDDDRRRKDCERDSNSTRDYDRYGSSKRRDDRDYDDSRRR